jgi:hypothetical protein
LGFRQRLWRSPGEVFDLKWCFHFASYYENLAAKFLRQPC